MKGSRFSINSDARASCIDCDYSDHWISKPRGIIYDGSNIWVADLGSQYAQEAGLDRATYSWPLRLALDPLSDIRRSKHLGSKLDSSSVSVVRATGGFAATVLATLPATAE